MKEKILNLFAYDSSLSFSEIKKKLKVRSNLLAYWLKQLLRKKILEKNNKEYILANEAEYLVPYLSQSKSALPVVLIQIGNSSSCFLYKRTKRPYKDLLSLPGGRILIGESLKSASERIMKTKFSILLNDINLKSIHFEHVKRADKTIYTFILFLVTAKAEKEIILTPIQKNKKKIIQSDFKLIVSNHRSKEKINILYSKYK